ncbi:MAG: glycosyltransferase family 2 protein [Anaerolineales bacterium]|nr:glycosyltransferase family 2 protein [Anaerolineales bacterium]
MNDFPFVSVVIPVRDEEKFIAPCLQSVIDQDYPTGSMEVLVVDGRSEDRSREIVAEFSYRHFLIKLLDNPKLSAPAGLNLGIEEAKGDIIVRVDGHCVLEPDYVSQCVRCLRETGADNVGGLMKAVGQNYVEQTIALAINSFFGSGGSKFHYAQKGQYVDTVYLGAFRRSVFDDVGFFNEKLVRNQDYELNYRIRAAGGKIFLSPAIKSSYYGRSTLRDLWYQYLQYGFWKLEMLQMHPQSVQPRHLAAPLFVFSLLVTGLLGLIYNRALILFLLTISSYLLVSLLSSLLIALRKGWRYFPLLPVTFAVMHFGWGLGFLWGLVSIVISVPHPTR